MKKLIAIVMMLALTMSVYIMAETIQEGRNLHPKAVFFYCKKKIYGEDVIPPMSSIERVAIDGLNFYIKFYEQDEELNTRLNGSREERGDWRYYPLSIGGIAINIEDEKLVFFNSSGEMDEVFDLDIKKSAQSASLRQ